MPGPTGKHPSVRGRRNVSSTKATLSVDHDIEAPELPENIAWHSMVSRWWDDIWASPMAPEYTDSDVNGLFRVAMLYNDFWWAETPKERAEIQVRLEKADADYGTNPMARRRLEWQIEATEDSKAKGSKRRKADQPATPPPPSGDDPRSGLYAV
ncbi:hypothetical protein A5742_26170 [Mycolicibacterium fortuitum]|uniref:Bacteriophage protein n=1 Tax=Mycolicibacterium fortuitum TaxID=1766 RepID=A0ABD6QM96_MYCFO|nr:hypothetical protein A5742_26170 [Mycolicibacterium fortuitum]